MVRRLALACLLPLGACALNSQPGTTPSTYDAVYSGTVTYVHAAPNGCPSTAPAPSKLPVENGSVVWTSGGAKLYAPVARDGSFYVANGLVYFSGKITNRSLVARVNTGSCHQIYDLTRPS